ncbi:MAG: FGGY-family carbohydrate kinase [Candidatus Nitrotoga sp.]
MKANEQTRYRQKSKHPPAKPGALNVRRKGDADSFTLLLIACYQKMTFYLGLDFGTSSARACAVDKAKNIVHQYSINYPTDRSETARTLGMSDMPGMSGTLQTPLDWRAALHSMLINLPPDVAGNLAGVAIAATSATVLLCDDELEPTSPALMYFDSRAQTVINEIQRIAPPDHITRSTTSALAKFLWLMKHIDLTHTTYFMHQADWLTALLTGQGGISDYHNALKSGYDVENLCWPEWVQNLPYAHLLPAVVAPGTVLTTIHPVVAAHFNINPACLIHAGTTDSIAAFIATGIDKPGAAVSSLGTTIVLKLLSTKRVESAQYGVYSHRYGDLWLVGGASNAGGGVLRQYFSNTQLEMLSAQINPKIDSPLDYYPLPRAGERFPINDPTCLPRLTPRPESAVEFLHGLLQGLTRIESAGYDRLCELGASPLRAVATCGGGAKNNIWHEMRARQLKVPVTVAAHTEAAYGAAMLALRHGYENLHLNGIGYAA